MNTIKHLINKIPMTESIAAPVRAAYYAIFEELEAPESIQAWLSPSLMKDPVYHATPNEFDKFDGSNSSPGGYAGKGIYFTDSPDDAAENYGKKTAGDHDNNRHAIREIINDGIEKQVTELMEVYYTKKHKSLSPEKINEIAARAGESISSREEEISESALDNLVDTIYGTNYRTIPAFIRITNPLVLKKGGGTVWESNSSETREPDYDESQEEDEEFMQAKIDAGYEDEDYDTYYSEVILPDYYDKVENEIPDGQLDRFIVTLKAHIMENYTWGDSGVRAMGALVELFSEIGEADYVWDVMDAIKRSDIGPNYMDQSLMVGELINQFARSEGYDSIVMDPEPSWGMEIPAGTHHYIIFDEKNIKSAITGENI